MLLYEHKLHSWQVFYQEFSETFQTQWIKDKKIFSARENLPSQTKEKLKRLNQGEEQNWLFIV